MNLERLLLRLIPGLLIGAGAGVSALTDVTHSVLLSSAAIGLSLLMVVSLLFFERDVRRSEDRLRERSEIEKAPRTGASVVLRGWQPNVEDALDFDNVSVKGLSFPGAEMSDASFSGASLRNCVWTRAHLQHAAFLEALLEQNNLEEASLKAAVFRDADVRRCDFSRTRLEGSDWSNASLEASLFKESSLSRARFIGSRLTKCRFDNARGMGVDFSGATLEDCGFEGGRFVEANFSHATLAETDLRPLEFSTLILDHTLIDTSSGGHDDLIKKLLELLSGPRAAGWVVIETPVAYVQAINRGDHTIRYETVNFDSWPGTRKTRRMTDAMRANLSQLGFEAAEANNYFGVADFSEKGQISSACRQLAAALHDVYGVSPDAPLEVTVGGAELDTAVEEEL